MKTLIVPCIGRTFINNQPKWALMYSRDEILLSACIKGLGIDNFDRIIVSLLKDDLTFYSPEDIKKAISPKIEICFFEKETRGPADTVYETIVRMGVTGSIQIKDISTVLTVPHDVGDNFITGIHLFNYDSNIKNLRKKSFITRNENNIVMDIIEKDVKSDIISIGLYGFASAEEYVEAYRKLEADFAESDTMFVSHIITYLIGVEKKVFVFVEVPNYELFESTWDYQRFNKGIGTYIFDCNKYDITSWLESLKKKSKDGNPLVFIVNDNEKKRVEELLSSMDIKGQFIIDNQMSFVKLIESVNDLKENS